MTTFAYRPVTKESQLHRTRIKPTQKQMGDISPKVRNEVRLRSGGVCEVKERCNGAPAIQQATYYGTKAIDSQDYGCGSAGKLLKLPQMVR